MDSTASGVLREIMQALALSKGDTGRIFQVTSDTIDAWLVDGVPVPRVADVDHVRVVVLELCQRFLAENLPRIVRRPMSALESRSVFEMLATEDGRARVRTILAEPLTWATS